MLSGNEVLAGISILSISLFIAIIGNRYFLKRKKTFGQTDKVFTTKYSAVDTLKSVGRNWVLGLGVSMATVLLLMSWTSYQQEAVIEIEPYVPEPIELIPRTVQQPPSPPPPPPPPPVITVTEDPVENPPDLIDTSVEIEDPVFTTPPPIVNDAPPPPLPPPPPPIVEDADPILDFSEKMPLFGGCEDRECSDKKLLLYLSKNIKYPVPAKENRIEGRVFIQFIVEKDGQVSNYEILRGVGVGCDKEVLRVVEKMNHLSEGWIPGKHRGRTVRVKYTLPVTFKLND